MLLFVDIFSRLIINDTGKRDIDMSNCYRISNGLFYEQVSKFNYKVTAVKYPKSTEQCPVAQWSKNYSIESRNLVFDSRL